MFLTAGSTEMCWFMPRPETFGSLEYEFHVSGCIYAGLFNRLNAPELADLIRLEEKQEIERLISCCCMTCDYRLTGNGCADIVFTIPAET